MGNETSTLRCIASLINATVKPRVGAENGTHSSS